MLRSSYHPTISLSKHHGFTLIELMLVMTIIITLLGLSFFPYSYYIQRASVTASIDTIGQSWILAHKDIRNGQLFNESKSANKIFIMNKWSNEIEQYIFAGWDIPNIDSFSTHPDIRKEKSIMLDWAITLLDFSSSNLSHEDNFLGYYIEAPNARWMFFTGAWIPFSSTGIFLRIGYSGASIESGRVREILLRPYLQ